ncbi:MAG: putative transcriptional regulator, PucR family [Conexibacter sp.]|nr:putative transcriptional regulator, PucR family [Conexibacter sp.]
MTSIDAAPPPTGVDSPGRPTLHDVLEHFTGGLVDIVCAPRGVAVPVSEPVIHDSAEDYRVASGDIVLAVGVEARDAHAPTLLADAAAAGAAAVVFHHREPTPARLVTASETSGVALLTVAPALTWGELHGLLRSAIAVAAPAADPSSEGVPLGDLFGLANAIAATVGGAVVVYDANIRVLAHSTLDDPIDEPRREAILNRHSPAEIMKRLRDDGVLAQMLGASRPVRFEYADLRTRLDIAVRAGQEVTGLISVMEGHTPLGPEAEEALLGMAQIAAPHLVYHLATRDVERRMRGDALRALLHGRGDVPTHASRLGLDATEPVAVIAFHDATPASEPRARTERLSDLVAFRAEALGAPAACGAVDGCVYLLVARPDDVGQTRLVSLATEIVQVAERTLGASLRAGLGSAVDSLHEAHRSRSQADMVVRVLGERLPGTRVAEVSQVRAHVTMGELRELARERPYLMEGRVARLAAHDADHDTHYVETLRAYMDAFGQVPIAARRLDVHPNTFRYRMRRLAELAGLDLDDPDERLVAALQLRFL